MSERDHLQKMIDDAIKRIAGELGERLEADLSEADVLAVGSALMKAATAGMKLGAADIAAQMDEAGHSIDLDLNVIEGDAWVEEGGEEEPR